MGQVIREKEILTTVLEGIGEGRITEDKRKENINNDQKC